MTKAFLSANLPEESLCADMEPPEQSFFDFTSEKLGAEEADAMLSDFGNGFTDSDYTIWVRDEGLSSPSTDE